MAAKIRFVKAKERFARRGLLSLEVTVITDDGAKGVSTPESGVSKGKHEATFILDGDDRYNGLGVLKAAANVNDVIGPAITGIDVTKQSEIDQAMIELDGTQNKSRLGANSINPAASSAGRPIPY